MRLIARIVTKKHEMQRYNAVGDWKFDLGELFIAVSDCNGAQDYENLIAIHEIIEALLCQARGITDEQIDKWDLDHTEHPNPGYIPQCPYFREHMFATMIERAMAAELDVDWDEYETCLEDLAKLIPNRQAVVCRELTKTFEQFVKGDAGYVLDYFTKNTDKVRGEFVVIVAHS